MESTQTLRTSPLQGKGLIHKLQSKLEAIRQNRQDRKARREATARDVRQQGGDPGRSPGSGDEAERRRQEMEREGVVQITEDGIVFDTAGPMPTTVVLQMAAWLATDPIGRPF